MKVMFTKGDLLKALEQFQDTDAIVIEVHDMVLHEDLYQLYVDSIHMGLDDNKEDRGHEIRLCPIQHTESWYEVYVDLGDEGTMTVQTFDDSYPLFLWYAKLAEEGEIDGIPYKKSKLSVDAWVKRSPDGQPEKSHTLI